MLGLHESYRQSNDRLNDRLYKEMSTRGDEKIVSEKLYLEEQINQLTTERDKTINETRELQVTIIGLVSKNSVLQEEIQKNKQVEDCKLKEVRDKLDLEKQEIEKEHVKTNQLLEIKSKKVEQLNAELSDVQNKLKFQSAREALNLGKLNRMKNELDSMKNDVKMATTENALHEKRIEQLQADLNMANTMKWREIKKLKERIFDRDKNYEELEEKYELESR